MLKIFHSFATDERDGGLANKGTALANRVSRRLVRSANHMLLNDANDYDVSDMDDVTTTIQRLVNQNIFQICLEAVDVGGFEVSV